MSERSRVDGQPAYILHSYPFRETSLIVEVFSRDFGRLALLARGARRPRSAIRGLLMGFQPLELGWAGKGDILNLMKAEWVGGQPLLAGPALFCAYYLNELLMHLLPREDAHPRLFAAYTEILASLATHSGNALPEADLRRFEKALLQEVGYGLNLTHDSAGREILPDGRYTYRMEHGAVLLADDEPVELAVSGRTLLDLGADSASGRRTAIEAKQLMRTLLAYYLSGKKLESRRIFRELQEL